MGFSRLPPNISDSDLIVLVQAGASQSSFALDILLRRHERRMRSIIKALGVPLADRDDALQHARLGLVQAVTHFDSGRGCSFASYSRAYIRGAALRFLPARSQHRNASEAGQSSEERSPNDDSEACQITLIRMDASLEAVLDSPFDRSGTTWQERQIERIESADATGQMQRAVRIWVSSLPDHQRDLLRRIYWRGESQAHVARARGIDRAAVCQQLRRTLEKGRSALDAVPEVRRYRMV